MKIFNYFKRLRTFLVDVRSEFKKVSWPPRREVYGTTVVVIITVFFFGFYLYGLDVAMSYLAAWLTGLVGGA
ncbi:MAG TPA: preprotein translocase subunit SecE [Vicinamibacteria bacterium]|nr:preprotein translocase subunit SecE [Vicinamibacteria bacterium]